MRVLGVKVVIVGKGKWLGGNKLRLEGAMFVYVRQLLYWNASRKGVKVGFSRRAERQHLVST